MGISPEHICFENDASAYALGEMGFGAAQAAAKAFFICIGTGCGSAFGLDGKLAPVENLCHGAGIRLAVTEDTSLRTLQGLACI